METIQTESLNTRGLENPPKYILDKVKSRKTDIMMLQETHWDILV